MVTVDLVFNVSESIMAFDYTAAGIIGNSKDN